ncbi:probable LRR receptor-like serine/threonine-protein kinase At1g56130 [Rosa rugosa]|uniref:probable LRR receptor-like serine/threonine-protein kinase At1g56130 n=1 Tax=Rosa rugosa TaxID=74645 RepID=UPI002B40312D|nr:probable LRR receptor-like serine/threonine-protein kinase At1g56130 [Rosa rugosa]
MITFVCCSWASDIELSGSIPDFIGNWSKLTSLDLIFNNLTGQIPDSLFNLSSLSILFLGNNKLNGALSESKSSSLLNVDLSYNNLVGSIPSWVNGTSLQLKLSRDNYGDYVIPRGSHQV